MNVLHIFNPEHDIALASGLTNFTAPHAARQLRNDLSFLPSVWIAGNERIASGKDSHDNHFVLTGSIPSAHLAWSRLKARGNAAHVMFVDWKMLSSLTFDAVDPWGWDAAVCRELARYGVAAKLLPSDEQTAQIRQLSHRRMAAGLLSGLHTDGTCGEAVECCGIEDVCECLGRWKGIVLKAPWSSSGRGVRFIPDARQLEDPNLAGWIRRVVGIQGSVMTEPLYDKLADFGMEFTADGKGGVSYDGLSLFETRNGSYAGNVIATEKTKRQWLARFVPETLTDYVREYIINNVQTNGYHGPFGVDMMVVKGNGRLLLHPCVEINYRRTMGHVALALTPLDDEGCQVMRIAFDGHKYKLNIRKK